MIQFVAVISQRPPGGRCTLYAGYAQVLNKQLGLSAELIYTLHSDPHGAGFPALLMDGSPVKPADGVILAPEDLTAALAAAGLPPTEQASLAQALDACLEEFLVRAGA